MEPTVQEQEQALAAIRDAHPDAEMLVRGPADSWVVEEGAERVVYLVDRPANLPAGADYTTWMVALCGGVAVRVSRFSSTACTSASRVGGG